MVVMSLAFMHLQPAFLTGFISGFHLQPESLVHPDWVLCPLHKAALNV